MPDKPVYKFSTTKPAAPSGAERREDHREDHREDRREDHRSERREDRREDNREDRREARFDNPTQDPNHPANRTLSRAGTEPFTSPVSVEDTMTEQEKDAAAGGPVTADNIPGVGPATATPEVEPAETIEEQGIGPRTPYPTGDPAPPDESVTRFQGIKTAKPPHNEPNKPLARERR